MGSPDSERLLQDDCGVHVYVNRVQTGSRTIIDNRSTLRIALRRVSLFIAEVRHAGRNHHPRPDLRHCGGAGRKSVAGGHASAHEIRSHDFLCLEQFQDGWCAIVNPHRKLGWALRWDTKLFPGLGFWQLFRGGSGYPWYGRYYLAALELLNELLSLTEAVERGTAFCLEGLDSVETVWEATAFSSPLDVKGVLPGGNIL